MAYNDQTAEQDALALLEGPLCRKHYQFTTKERVAAFIKRVVVREVDDALEKRGRK